MRIILSSATPIGYWPQMSDSLVQQVEEVVAAATADVDMDLWRDFEAEFGVGI